MNDLTFINHIENTQFTQPHRIARGPSSSPAQEEGSVRDTYVHGTDASCSVHRLGADSRGGFWGLFFSLFSSD